MTVPIRRSEPFRQKNYTLRRLKGSVVSSLKEISWLWKPLAWMRKKQKESSIQVRAFLAGTIGRWKGYYGPQFDVDHIMWIDPRQVVRNSGIEFSVCNFKGQVIGGDWDLAEAKFDDLDICAAIREVCQEEKQWPETLFYQRGLERLHQGLTSWGCSNQQALDKRCNFLERLYGSIRNEGYKMQSELALFRPKGEPEKVGEEEIGVNIGRSGDMLFSDGGHRLAIAKTLGLQKIPVKVVVRHTGWADLRKRLLRYARECDVQRLQPLPHPDLFDIPYNKEYERLLQVILDDLPERDGSILNIGAQFGYFCHRFEEQGRICYAQEDGQEELQILRALHCAMNRNFQIIEGPVHSFAPLSGIHFEAIFVLDTLLKGENQIESLTELVNDLRQLAFDRLYLLSPGCESSASDGRLPESESSIPGFLIDHIGPRNVETLTRLSDGQALYVLK